MGGNVVKNIILAGGISPAFALVFVALRFYTARTIIRHIHKDDCTYAARGLLCRALTDSALTETKYGLGMKYFDWISMADDWHQTLHTYMLLGAFPTNITGYLASLFTKSSILVFYLRFSTSRRFNIAVYVILFMVISHNFLGATTILYACRPISKFWTFSDGSCIDPEPWYGTMVALNVATDLILLLLPIWLLKPLSVGFAQKAALAAILGTGGFVLGISVLRFVIVVTGFGDPEATYRFGINFVWRHAFIIETNVAIICACLPCLRALLVRVFPTLGSSLSNQSTSIALDTISITNIPQQTPWERQEQRERRDRQEVYNDDKRSNESTAQMAPSQGTPYFGPDRTLGRDGD
ncbi:hypothetical protein B0T17DRAFT_490862 [Bombardia bombarda]|uniref:Rhodopsin domain-containing protein n=1 Tax=Bombardia bombarda TaxID=252184 RepID=A0AA39XBN5_9PEZI|nr:hypothetical protein B0T17DRAFT_490862 [Bombardia bombarda]